MKYFRLFLNIIILCFFYACGGISDHTEELSGGYQFNSESKNDQIIAGHGNIIPTLVISYVFNDDYILAAQKVLPDTESSTENIKNVDAIQFWIIDVNENVLHGPLNVTDFLKQKSSLGISEELKLKIEL